MLDLLSLGPYSAVVRLKSINFHLFFAFCLGILAMHLRLRLNIVDPKNFSWLWQGDWANAASGFLFYVQDSWRMPLGKMENILQPFGSSIGFTDSIPYMAFLMKGLSPILPFPFHYLGIYFLFCFGLQALFAFLIGKELKLGLLESYVLSFVFALSPPLLYRIGHVSLCSHFLILAQIYFYLKYQSTKNSKVFLFSYAVVFLATGVHPYLWAMSFVLGLALELEFLKLSKWNLREALKMLASFFIRILVSLVGLYLVGYFLPADKDHGGFSFYRSDLTAFFNPMGEKALMPRISASPGQYEAYSYLGIGTILLLFFILVSGSLRKKFFSFLKEKSSLLVLAFLMWIYSLSNEIAFAGRTLADIGPIYKLLGPIPNTFRSSGRFSWPLFYLLMFGVWFFASQIELKKKKIPIYFFLGLQIFDLKTYFDNLPPRVDKPLEYLQSEFYKIKDLRSWKQLRVLPQGGLGGCSLEPGPSHDLKKALVFFAALNHLPTNMGDVSRFPKKDLENLCLKDFEDFRKQNLTKDVLYLVYRPSFEEKDTPNSSCLKMDGPLVFCFDQSN